jgi:hypothetical protein
MTRTANTRSHFRGLIARPEHAPFRMLARGMRGWASSSQLPQVPRRVAREDPDSPQAPPAPPLNGLGRTARGRTRWLSRRNHRIAPRGVPASAWYPADPQCRIARLSRQVRLGPVLPRDRTHPPDAPLCYVGRTSSLRPTGRQTHTGCGWRRHTRVA